MTRCRGLEEEQLSLYVDGLLGATEAAAVRAHLERCPACASLVADLGRIVGAARLLGPVTPPAHLCDAILRQAAAGTGKTHAGSAPARPRPLWRWAAVAATLVAAVSLAWMADSRARVTSPPPKSDTSLAIVAPDLELAVHHYERAFAELESIAVAASRTLDPAVAHSVHAGLGTLDRAIAESRAALGADPSSELARISLLEAYRHKVALLQRVALIVNDVLENHASEATAPAPEDTGREL